MDVGPLTGHGERGGQVQQVAQRLNQPRRQEDADVEEHQHLDG